MNMIRRLGVIGLIVLLLIWSVSSSVNAGWTNVFDFPRSHEATPVDEGPHFHRFLSMREWWYFNVHFDNPESELRNWSAMISFNYMSKSFDEPDILFITLYDDGNKTYGGMVNKERGVLVAKGLGVNVTFENSWARGLYPFWQL